jgi:hypothetical protein
MDDHVHQAVSTELDKGDIEGYGYRFVYQHLKSEHAIVGRHRVYEALRRLNPHGLRSRRLGTRAEQLLGPRAPGPNYAWSIDAHCKLEHFGIQIYAAIDVYSRYVV